jgi:hypothetical protein
MPEFSSNHRKEGETPPSQSVKSEVCQQPAEFFDISCERGAPDEAKGGVNTGRLPGLDVVQQEDISKTPVNLDRVGAGIFNRLQSAVLRVKRFLINTIIDEWQAAPISVIASVPSNIFTAFSVVAFAPWCARRFGGDHSVGYVMATSAAAVLLGYGSYLVGYYAMMAYKERSRCLAAKQDFDKSRFMRTVNFDFIMHLPNDLITITKTGVLQVGLLATGSADLFWSILISQTIIDLTYCAKEPVYWAIAKKLESGWRVKQGSLGQPANTDTAEVKADEDPDKAGNE